MKNSLLGIGPTHFFLKSPYPPDKGDQGGVFDRVFPQGI